ncbi:hypothetical protein PF011_g32920, partial [Phytophthora fragariae]
ILVSGGGSLTGPSGSVDVSGGSSSSSGSGGAVLVSGGSSSSGVGGDVAVSSGASGSGASGSGVFVRSGSGGSLSLVQGDSSVVGSDVELRGGSVDSATAAQQWRRECVNERGVWWFEWRRRRAHQR